MGLLILLALIALAITVIAGTFYRLLSNHAGIKWWLPFWGLVLCGCATGIWSTLMFEYSPSPDYRIAGFPCTVCIFHLEHGQWVDYVVPLPAVMLTCLTNITLITAVTVLPVFIASLLVHRWRYLEFPGKTLPEDP